MAGSESYEVSMLKSDIINLIEASPSGVIIVDQNDKIILCNDEGAAIFGYTKSELIGSDHSRLVPGPFREIHQKQLKNFFKKPTAKLIGHNIELVGLRKDGTEIPIHVSLMPLKTRDGLIVISGVRDLTEQRALEKKLKAEKEFSELLINSSVDGIFAFDTDCRFTVWNGAMEKIWGRSSKEVIGRVAFKVFPFLIETGEQRFFEETLNGKNVSASNRPYITTETGEQRFFESFYSPIKSKEEKIIGGIAVIRDITDRKKTEERLLAEKHRLQAVTEFTNCGLFILDDKARVTYANRVAEEWFGPIDEIRNEFCWKLFGLRDPEKECGGIQALKTGKRVRGAGFTKLVSGEERYLFTDVSPLFDEKGVTNSVIELIVDITDHKRIEERLQEKTREAIRQNRLTSDFLNILEITSTSMNFDYSVNKLLPFIKGLVECDICLVYDVDIDKFEFRPSNQLGVPKEHLAYFKSSAISPGEPNMPKLVKRKETAFMELGKAVEGELTGYLRTMFELVEAKSIAAIPLRHNRKVEAMIFCLFRENKKFTSRNREMVNKIKKHLEAFYLSYKHTSNLLEETMNLTEQIEMVESMSGIDRAILTSATEEEMTQSAVRQLGNVIKCEVIEIMSLDELGETFKLAAVLENNESQPVSSLKFKETDMRSWNDIMFGVPSYYPYLTRGNITEEFEKRFLERRMNSLLVMPLINKSELIGVIAFGSKRHAYFNPKLLKAVQRMCDQYSVALSNARLVKQLQRTLLGTVRSLVTALDAKSKWTRGHSHRVTDVSLKIGDRLRLNESQVYDLKLASLFHDAGKIGTFDSILNKKTKLDDEEFELIKKHPAKTFDIISPVTGMERTAIIARHHHERWDGGGYPDGLKGDEIPYLSRIIAIADTYDAMSSVRPYRDALSLDKIILEFERNSGSQFDPEICDIFIDILYEEAREHKKPAGRKKRAA